MNYIFLSLSSTTYNAPAGKRVLLSPEDIAGRLGPGVGRTRITMGDRGDSILVTRVTGTPWLWQGCSMETPRKAPEREAVLSF